MGSKLSKICKIFSILPKFCRKIEKKKKKKKKPPWYIVAIFFFFFLFPRPLISWYSFPRPPFWASRAVPRPQFFEIWAAHTYQNQSWVPPLGIFRLGSLWCRPTYLSLNLNLSGTLVLGGTPQFWKLWLLLNTVWGQIDFGHFFRLQYVTYYFYRYT